QAITSCNSLFEAGRFHFNRAGRAGLNKLFQIKFKYLMDIEKIKSEIKQIADGIEAKIEKANGQAKEAANESAQKVAGELKTEIAGMVEKHSSLTALYEKEKKAMQEQLDDISTKLKKGQAGADERKSYQEIVKAAIEDMHTKGL